MSQKKKIGPIGIAIGVLTALLALGATGYVVLVQREASQARRAAQIADDLEADVQLARRFIRQHGDLEVSPLEIREVKSRLIESLPRGRRDVTVLEHLREKARGLELETFEVNIEGGMVMDAAPQEDTSGLGPLSSDTASLLKSPQLTARFVGSYKQTIDFLKVLHDAPWMFEIGVIEVLRGGGPRSRFLRQETVGDEFDLQVRVTARYAHRCVQDPCVDPNQRRRR